MTSRVLFVHALSPLHAGTGHAVGAVDLPIARDRATDHPYHPGSGIKGALRDVAREKLSESEVIAIFGPETENAGDHAGAVAIGDANLLLLPVRSIAGTFAWVTSPFLLARFARDCQEAGIGALPIPSVGAVGQCVITEGSVLKVRMGDTDRVLFEDLDLLPSVTPQADQLSTRLGELLFPGDPAWRGMLAARLCVVHDDLLTFLARHATDVVTRIKLDDDKKTVEKGGLWTEESLPVETVLASLVMTMPPKAVKLGDAVILEKLGRLTAGMVQLGGKATVGRGRCRLVLAGGAT
jgi:CRISPR-associated protein Cmr4